MDILNTSFVYYGYLKHVFCILWISQTRLLYIMDILKTSFERYGCLKICFLYVMDVLKTSFVRYGCVGKISYLFQVVHVSEPSFVRYECLKYVIRTLKMSQRGFLYVMNVRKTSFVRHRYLKDVISHFLDIYRNLVPYTKCH